MKEEDLNKIKNADNNCLFECIYDLMKGAYNLEKVKGIEKVCSKIVSNECTDKNGSCYKQYKIIDKLSALVDGIECEFYKDDKNFDSDDTKTDNLIFYYEFIIHKLCEKSFLYGIEIGKLKNKI